MRRKVLLVGMLVIIILLQSVIPLSVVNASTSVTITLNDKLFDAIAPQLIAQRITASYLNANNQIIISSDQLARVTSLDLSNCEIEDLQGLSSFTNLTYLNLHANELTVKSHLEELGLLNNLEDLDLSSNKIESVKAISNFRTIKHADITNQEVKGRKIINVDTSEESSQEKTVVVTLPDILLEDGNQINPDWITAEILEPSDTVGYYGGASVNWVESIAPGSTDVTINIASGRGSSYHALKDLIKIKIDVKDSESKLANTKMTFYYAIVDSDETGIVFEDENLYKTVKQQLSAHQYINDELESYGSDVTLYKRAYDEALILVIDTDTILR